MQRRVLSEEDIEQFVEKGYARVPGAFSKQDAELARQFLWDQLEEKAGVLRDDSSTWRKPMVRLNETYRTPDFDRCNTSRFADAIEDLLGAGMTANRYVYGESDDLPTWGWWPVNFSENADTAWTVPTSGWHWDGIQFRHYLDAPDQGLLCLCLFSDIQAHQGGGTLVVEGSHRTVARLLARYPDGVELKEGIADLFEHHPYFAELTGHTEGAGDAGDRIDRFMHSIYEDETGDRLRVVETSGEAGDVFLCHPFLVHAASPNHSGVPRFMCNRTASLKERIAIRKAPAAEETPLERSIRLSLSR